MAFSPDGSYLISGSADRTVRVWDPVTGRPRFLLEGHTQGITSVVISADGKRILSGSVDGTVRLWEVDT